MKGPSTTTSYFTDPLVLQRQQFILSHITAYKSHQPTPRGIHVLDLGCGEGSILECCAQAWEERTLEHMLPQLANENEATNTEIHRDEIQNINNTNHQNGNVEILERKYTHLQALRNAHSNDEPTETYIQHLTGIDIDEEALRDANIALSTRNQYEERYIKSNVRLHNNDIIKSGYNEDWKSCGKVDVLVNSEVVEHIALQDTDKLREIMRAIDADLIIITTPDRRFNKLFEPEPLPFRHWDHKFEWDNKEFAAWCDGFEGYTKEYSGCGSPKPEQEQSWIALGRPFATQTCVLKKIPQYYFPTLEVVTYNSPPVMSFKLENVYKWSMRATFRAYFKDRDITSSHVLDMWRDLDIRRACNGNINNLVSMEGILEVDEKGIATKVPQITEEYDSEASDIDLATIFPPDAGRLLREYDDHQQLIMAEAVEASVADSDEVVPEGDDLHEMFEKQTLDIVESTSRPAPVARSHLDIFRNTNPDVDEEDWCMTPCPVIDESRWNTPSVWDIIR